MYDTAITNIITIILPKGLTEFDYTINYNQNIPIL